MCVLRLLIKISTVVTAATQFCIGLTNCMLKSTLKPSAFSDTHKIISLDTS